MGGDGVEEPGIENYEEKRVILHTSQGIFKLMGGSGLVMQIKCRVDVCHITRFKKKKKKKKSK